MHLLSSMDCAEDTELHLQFFRSLMNLRQIGRQAKPPCNELSHFEFMCLDTIEDYNREHPELPGIKASQLGQITKTSRPAISQHLNTLEEKGYLERTSSKQDRRVTYLLLTQKGKDLLSKRESDFQRSLRMLCDRLGHEDTKQLIKLFDRLAEIMMELQQEQSTHP